MGAVDDDLRVKEVKTKHLEDAIEALLKGDKVSVSETRPSGCSIQYEAKK